MWLCCHPLTEPGHEDRMTTRLLTSPDGLDWTDQRRGARRPPRPLGRPRRPGHHGARRPTRSSALYDGRADAASNWYETTGVARWDGTAPGRRRRPDPIASPHSDGAWRYATAVPLPDGRTRFYVEAARPDGAHDLVTLVR